jgi:hypothetical protein
MLKYILYAWIVWCMATAILYAYAVSEASSTYAYETLTNKTNYTNYIQINYKITYIPITTIFTIITVSTTIMMIITLIAIIYEAKNIKGGKNTIYL